MYMSEHSLTQLAVLSLTVSGLAALIIVVDIVRGKRQKMPVMNFVWPITALWAGPLGLLAYWLFGRPAGDGKREKPFWSSVLVGDTHCGAGCTIGDFIGEWVVFVSGLTIGGSRLGADYVLDFVCAFTLGIVFQYYSIAPMRGLSGWSGIKAAIRADAISLIAFEIGMFAWMALSQRLHAGLKPTQAAYWFMMQIAMLIGFLTAYPANWWLIRKGVKEAM
jgi:hypothetical protein